MDYVITEPDQNGEAHVINIDMGSQPVWWKSLPTSIQQIGSGSIIVLKVPGGTHWSGRGETKYHGAEFNVFRVLEVKEILGQLRFRCERVVEIPIRQTDYAGR